MTTSNTISKLAVIAQQADPLKAAEFIYDEELAAPIGLRLEFLGAVFELRVQAADDTITVSSMLVPGKKVGCKPHVMLDKLVGMRVYSAWLLTNQNGYEDGVELEFISTDRRSRTIRLIAAASQIIAQEVIDG